MSHAGTRARTEHMVVDITDEPLHQRRVQPAQRPVQRSITRGAAPPRTRDAGRVPPRKSTNPTYEPQARPARPASSVDAEMRARRADLDLVRALMFAQGLDERGKRLPLASDSMTDEECRPHHVVAERQGSSRHREEFAAIYRIAASFDDGLPNVSGIRPLTHKVRVATAGEQSMSAAGAPRFIPREAPNHLRAVRQRREVQIVDRRTVLAPTAIVENGSFETASPERRTTASTGPIPTASKSVRSVRSVGSAGSVGSFGSAGSGRIGPRMLAAAGRQHDASSTTFAVGALALARAIPVVSGNATGEAKPTRPVLRAVAAAPKKFASYGVVAFWVMFVMAFLFVAVVMHAGIANRQMTLDEINVRLEQSEYSNSQLRVEVASLQSPTRIADAASRLGLSSPTGIRFVQAIPASIAPASTPSVSVNRGADQATPASAVDQTGG